MDTDERELLGSIVESSNQYHNLILDYIEKYGTTDKLKPLLQSKKRWIEKRLEEEVYEEHIERQ